MELRRPASHPATRAERRPASIGTAGHRAGPLAGEGVPPVRWSPTGRPSALRRLPPRFAPLTLAYVGASYPAFVAADRFLTGDGVSVWFPPAALTLAFLVAVGLAGVPVVLATRLGLAVLMDPSFRLNNVVLTSAVVVGAYAGAAVVLRRRLRRDGPHLHHVVAFGAAALAAGLVATVLAVGYLVAATAHPLERFPHMAMSFWLGDVAAVLALAPWLSGLARPAPASQHTDRSGLGGHLASAEVVVQVALLGLSAWYAVAVDVSSPQFYPTFIPLIWIALRRGLRGAVLALAATGLLVPLLAVAHGATAAEMTDLQLFMVVYAMTGLVMGAVESDRRVARAQVVASEHQLREVIASATEAFVSFDGDGVVKEWNAAAEHLLGWPRAEILGRPLAGTVLPAEVRDTYPAGVGRAMAAHPDAAGRRLEVRATRRDGTEVPVEVVLWPIRLGGEIQVNAFLHDISQRQAAEASLRARAERDPLTGLVNRTTLMARLDEANRRAAAGTPTAVLFVDLDDFKPVNDRHGHLVGDQVLRVVADRILNALRSGDVAGRLGGDEFVAVCPGIDGVGAGHLGARLEESLAETMVVDGRALRLGASVGWTVAGADDDPEAVLQAADRAMYRRKLVRKGGAPPPSPAGGRSPSEAVPAEP